MQTTFEHEGKLKTQFQIAHSTRLDELNKIHYSESIASLVIDEKQMKNSQAVVFHHSLMPCFIPGIASKSKFTLPSIIHMPLPCQRHDLHIGSAIRTNSFHHLSRIMMPYMHSRQVPLSCRDRLACKRLSSMKASSKLNSK